MDTPEQAEIRRAVHQAAERTGWRKVARQVGMSTTGLRKALEGGRLREATWTKLRGWYVREVQGRADTPADSGAVLLEALLQEVAPALRDRVRSVLVEIVGRAYGEESVPAPSWLVDVPGGLEAYEAGTAAGRNHFALVELVRGVRFHLSEQPFAGEPRAVVEEIATRRGAWQGTTFHPPHRISRVYLEGGE